MLIEREAQCTVLEDAVRNTGAGAGGLLVIRGEARTGASTLLRQLARIAGDRGARILRAAGARDEQDFPLGVIRQLVLPVLDDPAKPALPPIAGRLLRSLAEVAPLPAGSGPTLYGLQALLTSLARTEPVLVLIDDLRWVDEPSLRAVAFLAARLRGTRVLLGTVLQDGPGGCEPLLREIALATTCEVRVEPLSPAGTGRLAAARFGPGHAPAFAAACHELTGGRPKDLQTLLDRAFARRLTGRASDVGELRALGAAARQERLRSLVRCTPEVGAFARAVVVLGRRAQPELVARLSGLDDTAAADAREVLGEAWLGSAADGRLVPEPDLIQVVEETLTSAEAAAAHRAAVVLLAAQGFPPEHVAAQLLYVDKLHGRDEFETLRAAAVEAQRRGAPDVAARYLRRALLDLPSDCPGRAWLLTELATAELEHDQRAAVRYLVQAVPLLPPGRDRATAVARIPLLAAAREPLVTKVVRELTGPGGERSDHDRDLTLRLESRDWFTSLDDPARLAAASARLRELPDDPAGPGPAERELRAVLLLAAVLAGRITAVEAAKHAVFLLDHEPAHAVRAGTALRIVPLVLITAGRVDVALPWLASADGPDATGATTALIDAHRALALLSRGQFAKARFPAERAFRTADPSGYDVLALPATALGLVADSSGSGEVARQVLEGLPVGDDLAVFAVRRGLQGMLVARTDPDAALAQFLDRGRCLDLAGWRNPAIYGWRGSTALLAHCLGRTEEAQLLAEEHHRYAVAWGAPATVGHSLRVLAGLADNRRAAELLREAVELLGKSPDALEEAKACADLGVRLRATDPDGSRQFLARSQHLAQSCGAGRLVRCEDGTFDQEEPASAVAVLTSGEAAVAKLAVAGRTNVEIAEELSVSRRGVEKHLTSLYRKFEIDGRAQLAEVLGDAQCGKDQDGLRREAGRPDPRPARGRARAG